MKNQNLSAFFMKAAILFALFFTVNANAQFEGRTQTISQVVTHDGGSITCGGATYTVALIVGYTDAGGTPMAQMSAPVTNMAAGTNTTFSVSIPGDATVLSTSIRIVGDNGAFVWDLSNDSENYEFHPTSEWLNCGGSTTEVLHTSDYGSTFHFSFGFFLGTP